MTVRTVEISLTYSFKNNEGILSGPQALLVFSEASCLVTPAVVIMRGEMLDFVGSFPALERSEQESLVNSEENGSFKISNLVSPSIFPIDLEISNAQVFFLKLFDIGPEALWALYDSFSEKICYSKYLWQFHMLKFWCTRFLAAQNWCQWAGFPDL